MSISFNFDEVTASLFKLNQGVEQTLPKSGAVAPLGVHSANVDVGPAADIEQEIRNSAVDIGKAILKVQSLLSIEHEHIKATMAQLVALDESLADESELFLSAIDSVPTPASGSTVTAAPSTSTSAIG